MDLISRGQPRRTHVAFDDTPEPLSRPALLIQHGATPTHSETDLKPKKWSMGCETIFPDGTPASTSPSRSRSVLRSDRFHSRSAVSLSASSKITRS